MADEGWVSRYQRFSPAQFDELVDEALEGLPPYFRDKMSNVAVLTKMFPSRDELARVRTRPGHTLLGLYTGIPLTRRTHGYSMVAPDTITLFQGPIEAKAGWNPERVREQVRHVFLHELAHHFGISDDRLRELGAY